MSTEFDFKPVDEILKKYDFQKTHTISILQDVQAHYRYLPQAVFAYIAPKIGSSEAELFSVATFYENFSLVPKGKCVIKVCDGTACHVRKSIPILNRLREELKLDEEHPTTEDGLFTVETVACLGACGLGPALTVNGKVHPTMTPDKASELLKKLKEEYGNA
ncbi:MAG: NAD(P)H-dependent oxidoreductase subunit E [Clostridiales bacterium]|nr:NAD(P)H-dependent oxidoreductase subunit E [Clostridiales bacterium]